MDQKFIDIIIAIQTICLKRNLNWIKPQSATLYLSSISSMEILNSPPPSVVSLVLNQTLHSFGYLEDNTSPNNATRYLRSKINCYYRLNQHIKLIKSSNLFCKTKRKFKKYVFSILKHSSFYTVYIKK